ncbi:MAG: hypothetical protein PHX40_03130 [Bacilli bacterium]|nr:hypothetical protein [Bacilli bacterium]
MKDKHSISKDLYLIGTISSILGYATTVEEKKENFLRCKHYLGNDMILSTSVNIYTNEYINSTGTNNNESYDPELETGKSEKPFDKNVYSINLNLNTKGKNTRIYIENHPKEDTFNKVLSDNSTFEEKFNFINNLLDNKSKVRIFPSNKEYNLSELEKDNIHEKSNDMLEWLKFRAKLEKDNKSR